MGRFPHSGEIFQKVTITIEDFWENTFFVFWYFHFSYFFFFFNVYFRKRDSGLNFKKRDSGWILIPQAPIFHHCSAKRSGEVRFGLIPKVGCCKIFLIKVVFGKKKNILIFLGRFRNGFCVYFLRNIRRIMLLKRFLDAKRNKIFKIYFQFFSTFWSNFGTYTKNFRTRNYRKKLQFWKTPKF